ncbi:ribonuclease H-like domain-containing protein, partial [Lentinula aff. lateritia]
SGEIIGIREAIITADEERELIIHSDSKTCIQGLTKNLRKWEDSGYADIKNAKEIRATVANARQRKATTTLHWVKGHSGIDGNEKADELADKGRDKETPDDIVLEVERELRVSGARLQYVTQSLAQKLIRHKK